MGGGEIASRTNDSYEGDYSKMMRDFLRTIGAGRLKSGMKVAISRHRQAMPIKLLHEVTAFIEESYANEGSDFASNGEHDLLKKLKQADFRTAYDVGANTGAWSLAALSLWPNCRVHAFEVAPDTYKELQQQVAASGFADRIVLNDFGVSDANGTMTMYYYPDSPELTCDSPRHENEVAVPFEARLERLDEYSKRHGIEQVDFLKVDVEGAENRVFKGFADFLDGKKVNCIQFEYGAFSIQTRFLLNDYYKLLSERYWMGKIYPSYVDFRDYEWRMENFRFCNYFCVSRDRPDLKKLLEA